MFFTTIVRACSAPQLSGHYSVCKILFTDTNTGRIPAQNYNPQTQNKGPE